MDGGNAKGLQEQSLPCARGIRASMHIKWMFKLSALPKRWISVTAPVWALLQEYPALTCMDARMPRGQDAESGLDQVRSNASVDDAEHLGIKMAGRVANKKRNE
jgi:hypothetical protein